ncbi:pyridoxamine 5'-phosphate oxidase family protein [Streptomyces flaveolus]
MTSDPLPRTLPETDLTRHRRLADGVPVCVTVTQVDGLVPAARSVFEHGVNHRSAVLHGEAREVTDPDEKREGLRRLTEHATPGQWSYARHRTAGNPPPPPRVPSPWTQASVEIRTGDPDDGDGPGAALGPWAGTLPLTAPWGTPAPPPGCRRAPIRRHTSRAGRGPGTDDAGAGAYREESYVRTGRRHVDGQPYRAGRGSDGAVPARAARGRLQGGPPAGRRGLRPLRAE